MAGKLNDLDFSAAAASLKMGSEVLAAARQVLVNGDTQVSVRLATGLPKQTIYNAVTRVAKAHSKLVNALATAAPAGWSVAILALPADQMDRVKAQEALARAALRAQEVE